jgi:hypothetical protein
MTVFFYTVGIPVGAWTALSLFNFFAFQVIAARAHKDDARHRH